MGLHEGYTRLLPDRTGDGPDGPLALPRHQGREARLVTDFAGTSQVTFQKQIVSGPSRESRNYEIGAIRPASGWDVIAPDLMKQRAGEWIIAGGKRARRRSAAVSSASACALIQTLPSALPLERLSGLWK